MAKVDIFSGFLGAGKTTLIRKLIEEAYGGEQIVLIENEFGEIGIDGGFLKDSGIRINEMNAGCICCSLVGDFSKALRQVYDEFHPDRILIEPSGVGKLSDIVEAVEGLGMDELELNSFTTVVDAKKAKVYMKNFGEFYSNQVEHASAIVLSHTQGMDESKLKAVLELLRSYNEHAAVITTEWDQLTGSQILNAMENKDTLMQAIAHLEEEQLEHEHHHHHHDGEECDDPECECHHHEEEHEHHHHHDGEECDDPECECHHHHHGHEGHHHADEVFDSYGYETSRKFTADFITSCLEKLSDFGEYGQVLRAKGIVQGEDGKWIHFDYVPGEPDVRYGSAEITGRIVVIGAGIDEDAVKQLFGL